MLWASGLTLEINFVSIYLVSWEEGKKVYINGQGHMTKMAAMAINRKKNFKNLLLENQKASDFETWCEASVTGALQNLYKS